MGSTLKQRGLRRHIAGAAVGALFASGGLIALASSPALAACSQSSATTPVSAGVGGGRIVELRYNSSTNCIWGRITQANGGDQVKAQVENVATTATVTVSGSNTSAFSPALNRGSNRSRAWGKYERGIYPDQTAWTVWW